ncbi:MAG: hypothetical protein ACJ8AS_13395 [Hyphomicrobiales bacterium]
MYYGSRLLQAIFLASLLIALPLEIDRREFAAFANEGGSGSGDNSGPGGGDNSGRGGGDDSGRGGGKGGDDEDGSPASGSSRKGTPADKQHRYRLGPNGETIEIGRTGIAILYPDGFREAIRNGMLELTDPQGRRVVKRPATPKELRRVHALIGS